MEGISSVLPAKCQRNETTKAKWRVRTGAADSGLSVPEVLPGKLCNLGAETGPQLPLTALSDSQGFSGRFFGFSLRVLRGGPGHGAGQTLGYAWAEARLVTCRLEPR